jgi:hypothetical protein
MTLANGFMPLRRGVFEHLRDGRMCPTDFTCFAYIIGQADTRSGVWIGSAGALAMPTQQRKYDLHLKWIF